MSAAQIVLLALATGNLTFFALTRRHWSSPAQLRGVVFTPGEEWTIQGKQWVVVEVQWTSDGYITTRWQEKDKRQRFVEDLNDEVDW